MNHSRFAVIEAQEFNSPPSLAHDEGTTTIKSPTHPDGQWPEQAVVLAMLK
jgi:hypothetical protein